MLDCEQWFLEKKEQELNPPNNTAHLPPLPNTSAAQGLPGAIGWSSTRPSRVCPLSRTRVHWSPPSSGSCTLHEHSQERQDQWWGPSAHVLLITPQSFNFQPPIFHPTELERETSLQFASLLENPAANKSKSKTHQSQGGETHCYSNVSGEVAC